MKDFNLAQEMKKTLYAAWLGGSLYLAGVGPNTLMFWVVLLPTCLLVTVFNNGGFDLD